MRRLGGVSITFTIPPPKKEHLCCSTASGWPSASWNPNGSENGAPDPAEDHPKAQRNVLGTGPQVVPQLQRIDRTPTLVVACFEVARSWVFWELGVNCETKGIVTGTSEAERSSFLKWNVVKPLLSFFL